MENKNVEQKETEAPLQFSKEEMKMPEDTDLQSGNDTYTEGREKKDHILLFGILLVATVLLLMAGGYYIWSTMPSDQNESTTPSPEEAVTEPQDTPSETSPTEETVNQSDELEAIAEDLENTDLDTLDAELDALEAEIDTELQTQ